MKTWKKVVRGGCGVVALFAFLAAALSPVSTAFAQAQPIYNGVTNDAIYRVMQAKAVARGFPANDNRISLTAQSMSVRAAANSNVAGGVVSAGRALLWLPVMARRLAVMVGVMAITEGLQWVIDQQTMKVQASAGGTTQYPSMVQGSAGYRATFTTSSSSVQLYGSNVAAIHSVMLAHSKSSMVCGPTWSNCYVSDLSPTAAGPYSVMFVMYGTNQYGQANQQYDYRQYYLESVSLPYSSSTGMSIGEVPYSPAPPAQDIWEASDAISSAYHSQPVTSEAIAQTTDDLWKDAASQPGYQGLPYDIYDPITTSDAQAVRDADTAKWPKVSDLLRPVSTGATTGTTLDTVPIPGNTAANGGPVTNPGTSTGTGEAVNLGTDPGIPAPALEATPTASAIIAPLRTAFPGLKNWSVPAHTAACPKDSFTVWNKTYTIEAHCQFFEERRSQIGAALLAAWVLLSLIIVLRA